MSEWEPSHNGHIPSKAVVGGYDQNGEALYIGRVVQYNDLIPGKIVPSHHCCYVAFDGKEISHRSYQVLHSLQNFVLSYNYLLFVVLNIH